MSVTRRANGEGSVFRAKRKDGSAYWRGYLTAERDGAPARKWFSGETKAATLAAMTAWKAEVVRRGRLPDRHATLAEFCEEWLQTAVAPRVTPGTLAGYRTALARVTAHAGGVRLGDLSPVWCARRIRALLDEGYGAETVRQTHTVLRAALAEAVRWGLLAANPMAGVRPPAKGRAARPVLDSAGWARFLDAVAAEPDGLFYTLLLTTGLRLGEALGLRWEDVDFEAPALRVEGQLVRLARTIRRAPPKGKDARVVPVAAALAAALRAHRLAQTEARLRAAAWDTTYGALVFTRADGRPLAEATVTQRLARMCARAGLPPLTPHRLRASFLTDLARRGVPLKVAAAVAGHKRVNITADIYQQATGDMLAVVSEAMAAALSGRAERAPETKAAPKAAPARRRGR